MARREFPYVVLDVFTRARFGGNPLAVVMPATGLSDAEMQSIAREFNFSETTFVLPPAVADNTARVRIFNRTQEMPFAGHPNVGTAYAVGQESECFGRRVAESLRFEELAGLVDVQLVREGGQCVGATITAPQALEVGATVDPALVAPCAQLSVDDLRIERHLPSEVSVGLPFVVVEVAAAALDRAQPDLAAFRQAVGVSGSRLDASRFSLFLYARAEPAGRRLKARMFSPLSGTFEDPATGSASAALAAYLGSWDGLADGELAFTIEQGVKMGRPSEIELRVRKVAGQVAGVAVTGRVVPVMRGTLQLD